MFLLYCCPQQHRPPERRPVGSWVNIGWESWVSLITYWSQVGELRSWKITFTDIMCWKQNSCGSDWFCKSGIQLCSHVAYTWLKIYYREKRQVGGFADVTTLVNVLSRLQDNCNSVVHVCYIQVQQIRYCYYYCMFLWRRQHLMWWTHCGYWWRRVSKNCDCCRQRSCSSPRRRSCSMKCLRGCV